MAPDHRNLDQILRGSLRTEIPSGIRKLLRCLAFAAITGIAGACHSASIQPPLPESALVATTEAKKAECMDEESISDCLKRAASAKASGEFLVAKELYEFLCEKDNSEGCLQLGRMVLRLPSGKIDLPMRSKATDIILKSCNLGLRRGCRELLNLSKSGEVALPPNQLTVISRNECMHGELELCQQAVNSLCSGPDSNTQETRLQVMQLLKDAIIEATDESHCGEFAEDDAPSEMTKKKEKDNCTEPRLAENLHGLVVQRCGISRSEFFDYLSM